MRIILRLLHVLYFQMKYQESESKHSEFKEALFRIDLSEKQIAELKNELKNAEQELKESSAQAEELIVRKSENISHTFIKLSLNF